MIEQRQAPQPSKASRGDLPDVNVWLARLLTDAYLAAFAESAQLRRVTFDKDFGRFQGLDCLRLSTAKH